MKAVIQRVTSASVTVNNEKVSQINRGIVSLLGICKNDTQEKAIKMIDKICNLRIFPDENDKMNLSLKDISGEHLVVSNFTVSADCSHGRRPSFTSAEHPEAAIKLYEIAVQHSKTLGVSTQGGVFQADMNVSIENQGPVTFVLNIE